MSTSTHNIAIRGKDQTATAFRSIQARALAAGNHISKVMGGALAAAERAVRITNGLIEGGSNASRRLSLLGPDYQNKQKKQTDLLKKIAENTQQTADNTEGGDSLYQETDLGA